MKKLLIVIFAAFFLVGTVGFAVSTIYKYSKMYTVQGYTRYSKGYSENEFNRIAVGDNLQLVKQKLGKALYEAPLMYKEQLMYTNLPDSLEFQESDFAYNIPLYGEIKYKIINFNKEGKVAQLFGNPYLKHVPKKVLRSSTKEEIIALLGTPQKQRICNSNCILLDYSSLNTTLEHAEKNEYHIRRIILKDNLVFRKIAHHAKQELYPRDELCYVIATTPAN